MLNEREDGRYAHLRAHWNGHQGKFFAFFQVQALSVALFSLPFLIAANNPVESITVWIVLGVSLWLLSLVGESIADMQLARYRADPRNRGKTCRAGLGGRPAPGLRRYCLPATGARWGISGSTRRQKSSVTTLDLTRLDMTSLQRRAACGSDRKFI